MEVSNVRDHVTHAIISGGKTIDFGISNSPEFFHILSSTLYSDQPLAVVREVLCNGWDAHIEAGCTDKALEVTLTDEHLTIRDFGKGISDDDIGPIYGVYGASTKKSNQDVTGGFGLGCKAPFAYTDHFEVTSWHGGHKTIYNMSKSSAEVSGRPGIVPIASFPSDESGLQVKIPISSHDKWTFHKLINRIAANGEMNLKLNGNQIDVLPFSTMQHGFMLTNQDVLDAQHQNILVRYGHVIYPVDRHEEYQREFKKIHEFLGTLPNDYHSKLNYQIIFQAPADSISVTPSRESLSMQEHTISTLKKLFSDFLELLNTNLKPESFNTLQKSVVSVWNQMKPAELFKTDRHVPGLYRGHHIQRSDAPKTIVELPVVAREQLTWKYPEYKGFRYQDLLARTNSLIESGMGNTDLVKSYRAELMRLHRRRWQSGGKKKRLRRTSSWFQRKVLAPLIVDMEAAGLTRNRLSVFAEATYEDHSISYGNTFFNPQEYRCRNHADYLPFLREIVVLSHNRTDVYDRVLHFPIMKFWLGKSKDFLCYIVPRSGKQAEKARQYFKNRGVQLIDLTVYHPWEIPPVPVVKKPKAEPRAKGLPILSSLLNDGIRMDFLHPHLTDNDRDIQRTEKPKVVAKMPRKYEKQVELQDFGYYETEAICSLWADDIAIATTSIQVNRYVADGSVRLNSWVIEKVCAEVISNKRLHQAIASDPNRTFLEHYPTMKRLFTLVWDDSDLCKELGLTNPLTEKDRHYLTLWQDIERRYPYSSSYPEIKDARDFTAKIPDDPGVQALAEQMQTRRSLVEAIDASSLRTLLSQKRDAKMKPIIESTKQIVLLALKG